MPKTPTPEEEFDNDLFEGRTRPSEIKPINAGIAVPGIQLDSEKAASEDLNTVFSLKKRFDKAAEIHAVPSEILEGIASRETRVGKVLPKSGFGGKDGKMYGLLQVNSKVHNLEGNAPDSQEHINQAASILKEYKGLMDKRFPNGTEEQKWRAAVAGYNMGPKNVKTLDNLDKGTDDNNYSQDVMLRAKIFREKMTKLSKRR